jgi:hypothetical protein
MDEPFKKYRSRGLTVSELAQQLWCEKKVALELLYGKEETENMKIGRKRHEELFEEIMPVVVVHPETWIDELFVRFHQMWVSAHQIMKEGIAREIPVYGAVGTMMIKGIIDEVVADTELTLVETKTRASGTVPDYTAYTRVVEFQLSLYRRMLDNIIKEKFVAANLLKFYEIGADTCISKPLYDRFPEGALVTDNVSAMASTAFEALKALPHISDTMVVRYEDQHKTVIGEQKFILDEELFWRNVDFVLGFWKGQRDAVPPLKNPWKCTFCPEHVRNNCEFFEASQESSPK